MFKLLAKQYAECPKPKQLFKHGDLENYNRYECIALLPFTLVTSEYLYGDNPYEHHTSYASHYDNYKPRDYNFGYGVSDPHTGDHKSQWEVRENGVVRGSYSLLEADGTTRIVDYYADDTGFHADVKKIGEAVHSAPHHEIAVAPIIKNQIVDSIAYNGYGHGGLEHAYGAPIQHIAPIAKAVEHIAPVAHVQHIPPVQQVIIPHHSPVEQYTPAQYFEQIIKSAPVNQYAQLAQAEYLQAEHISKIAPVQHYAPTQYLEKIESPVHYAQPQLVEKVAPVQHFAKSQLIEKVAPVQYAQQIIEPVQHYAPAPFVEQHYAPAQYVQNIAKVGPIEHYAQAKYIQQVAPVQHYAQAPYLEQVSKLEAPVHYAKAIPVQHYAQAPYVEQVSKIAPIHFEKAIPVQHYAQPQYVEQIAKIGPPQQYQQISPAHYVQQVPQISKVAVSKQSQPQFDISNQYYGAAQGIISASPYNLDYVHQKSIPYPYSDDGYNHGHGY